LAREQLETTGIRLRLDMPESLPDLALPSDVRHNLVLFVKEAIHNVVKHAEASQLTVGIMCKGPILALTVSDDGRGMNAPGSTPLHCSHGNGLLNMQQRVESLDGQFELRSQPGRGTLVQARLNLGKL
jgi:signal transduction histidine kinase